MEADVRLVDLRLGAEDLRAELTLTPLREVAGRGCRLSVVCPKGRWSADGPDVFGALRLLMAELEADGGVLGVVGARPNAWASGMQRDMGEGTSVYLLSLPRTGERPPSAKTLDPAALDDVGTTGDQDAFQEQWMPKPAG